MTNIPPTKLSSHHCEPCEGGVEPLSREEFTVYLDQIKDWLVIDDVKIERELEFKNFVKAVEMINKIAELSEREGHHPDLQLHSFSKLKVSLSTHSIGGLSINDFVLAVKIDELYS